MNDSQIEPKTANINGINTVIRDAGGDSDTAVVFVHGNPGSGAGYARVWTFG